MRQLRLRRVQAGNNRERKFAAQSRNTDSGDSSCWFYCSSFCLSFYSPAAAAIMRAADRPGVSKHVVITIENTLCCLVDARHAVESFLAAESAELAQSATLLVSELVTNALMHGGPPVVASLDVDSRRHLRIAVSDGGHVVPRMRRDADETGGFGLRIVESLSSSWGCAISHAGKTMWCELLLPDAA